MIGTRVDTPEYVASPLGVQACQRGVDSDA